MPEEKLEAEPAPDSVPRPSAGRRRMSRGLYLLPSILTIGNMLLGFYALVLGFRGNYQMAALLVFAAAAVDGMDGRLARSVGNETEFGKEYDSLADVLAFGMVPALLTFIWGLDQLGRIGWLLPFFYVACTATRLARFNVQVSGFDKRFFVGLPAPAAAGLLCSLLFYAPDPSKWNLAPVFFLVLLGILGFLMLSTFRYYSFKELDPRRRMSYRAILPLLGFVLLVAFDPAAFFLALSGTYAASGPIGWTIGRFRSKPEPQTAAETPEVTE
jgi:CDP-diacylglycerol--serine O-phosphatidyltransferase